MSQVPEFLPQKEQDSVEFYVLKNLSYSNRMVLYWSLLAVGFLFQIIFMKLFPGAVFLICASVLNLTRGYDNLVKFTQLDKDNNWTQVDMAQINRVIDIEKKTKEWNKDIFDVSSVIGVITLILTIIVVMFATIFLAIITSFSSVVWIFLIDVIILMFPILFSGKKQILKQQDLNTRVDIIRDMEGFFRSIKKDGESFRPALMLSRDKNGKSVPRNSRFTISFDDMPEGFYGIQAQININSVEGTRHPYFYCVIAAKTGFGLENYVEKIPVEKNIVISCEKDNDAEVIVIRQHTTKTSGYFTGIGVCKKILETAVVTSRIILGIT